MEHPILRTNLRELNGILGLEDRRMFVREVGIGGAEFVSYLVGDRVPTPAKIDAMAQFFGLPDAAALRDRRIDELSLQRAQQRLRRLRREQEVAEAVWQNVG